MASWDIAPASVVQFPLISPTDSHTIGEHMANTWSITSDWAMQGSVTRPVRRSHASHVTPFASSLHAQLPVPSPHSPALARRVAWRQWTSGRQRTATTAAAAAAEGLDWLAPVTHRLRTKNSIVQLPFIYHWSPSDSWIQLASFLDWYIWIWNYRYFKFKQLFLSINISGSSRKMSPSGTFFIA